jgi:AFG3 family protein
MFEWFSSKPIPVPPPPPPNNSLTFTQLMLILFFSWWVIQVLKKHGILVDKNKKRKKRRKKSLKNNFDNDLSEIVGLESVKEELMYFMDFINNKKKYLDWNVNVPKGILLAGPPGTGKTLLVKTIANNLDIPIESMSGSEFVEMYVGVGASRVRKLFARARSKKKCIIFIDEIDAVGGHRGRDSNSERDSTLNQLLVEMDGFTESDNIMVFAATNLVKRLDSALTRSGRFDKKVYFDPPNLKERKAMFELYLDDVTIQDNLSFSILAERSAGLTGADIASICNQTKINAIQENRQTGNVTEDDIQKAIDEVMIGREKRERTMSKLERERVSHHEAGHALMGYLLKDCTHPVKVSIIPRGEAALGFSQQKNIDQKIHTEEIILSMIAVCLGGRSAEKVIYGNISNGAADDIDKVSSLIYNYSCSWGMNKKIGALNPNSMGQIGENMNDSMFDECKLITDKIENFVISTLTTHKEYVISIANSLLKNETITYKEINEILPKDLEDSLDIIKFE